MNTLADRLKSARHKAGLSQAKLADLAGVSQSTIGNLESGARFETQKAVQIARVLGVTAEWLLTGKGGNFTAGPKITSLVPLISWVQAGEWSEAIDMYEPGIAEEWLPCVKKTSSNTYALKVQGDSMTSPYGKSYPDGCIIFVDPDKRTPANGDRVIAKLENSNEVTFKVFQQDAGRVWLKPLNPQHPLIMDKFIILGTIVGKWEDE